MDTIKFNSRSARVIAHRGLSGIEKENTNTAFIAAGCKSYYGIETDVHVTVDGRFVCIHDNTTGRVAIDNLEIEKSTFDTLRRLQLCDRNGRKGREDLHIPTLTEYIETCKRYEKTAVLELKNEFDNKDIDKICEEIRAVGFLDSVIFISFAFDNLVKLRELYPRQRVQFLTDKYNDGLPELLLSHKFDLDICYSELTHDRVNTLHEAGIKINCWTCDSRDDAEKLSEYGVDFITSNILE